MPMPVPLWSLTLFLTLQSWKGQVCFLLTNLACIALARLPGWLSGQRLAILDIDLVVAALYIGRPLRFDP